MLNDYWDAIDAITVQNLRDWREQFKKDLKNPKPMVFETDPKADKKIIRRKIKAITEILEYAVHESEI